MRGIEEYIDDELIDGSIDIEASALGQYIKDRIEVYNTKPDTKGEGRLFDSFDIVQGKPNLSTFPEIIQNHVQNFEKSLNEGKASSEMLNNFLYNWLGKLYSLVADWIIESIKDPDVRKNLESYLKNNPIKDFIGGLHLSIGYHVSSYSKKTLASCIAIQSLSTLIKEIDITFHANKLSNGQPIEDAIKSPFIAKNNIQKMIKSSLEKLSSEVYNKILNATSISVREIEEIREKLSTAQFNSILVEMHLYLRQDPGLIIDCQLANIFNFLAVSGELKNQWVKASFNTPRVINSILEDKNFGTFYPSYRKAELSRPIIEAFVNKTKKQIGGAISDEEVAKIVSEANAFVAKILITNTKLAGKLSQIIYEAIDNRSTPIIQKGLLGSSLGQFLGKATTVTPAPAKSNTMTLAA